MKSAEDRLQAACVRWFDFQYPQIRSALFAVPNGGNRSAATGAILKRTGVRAGVADLLLAYNQRALFIEIKTPKGRQSASQKAFQRFIESQGFEYCVVKEFDAFRDLVQRFMARGAV